jgi:cell division septum initiation protein DivIVA
LICNNSEAIKDEGTQVVDLAEDIQDEEQEQEEERKELEEAAAGDDDEEEAPSAATEKADAEDEKEGEKEEAAAAAAKVAKTKDTVPMNQRWRVRVKYDSPADGGGPLEPEVLTVQEARSKMWVPPTGASSKQVTCYTTSM